MRIMVKSLSMLKKFFYDLNHFGIKIAHYNFWGEFAGFNLLPKNINLKIKQHQFKLNYDFLINKYSSFISEYKTKKIDYKKSKKIIWTCWWQGEDTAPGIVTKCINSIRKNAGDYKVVVITKDNYNKYVKIPDFILEKVKEGTITFTHFSDILRMALLSSYGGIWVDATMYICNDVFKEFDGKKLNSNYVEKIDGVLNNNKWCGFFIGGKPNMLFSFVYDFLIEYNRNYDNLINYFLIDYAIHIAYNNFHECKQMINDITFKNNDIFKLVAIFNEKYEKKQYNRIVTKGLFFKLSYKDKLIIKDKDGYLTNYGYFMNEVNK